MLRSREKDFSGLVGSLSRFEKGRSRDRASQLRGFLTEHTLIRRLRQEEHPSEAFPQ